MRLERDFQTSLRRGENRNFFINTKEQKLILKLFGQSAGMTIQHSMRW